MRSVTYTNACFILEIEKKARKHLQRLKNFNINTSWIRQQHLVYDRFFTKYIFVKKLSFYKYISV